MKNNWLLVLVVVILLTFTGVSFASNRIISSTNDNIYTKITNSNGKVWDATPGNIQVAINDLHNQSGIVWLPGLKTFYLPKTIVVWRNIMLDMGGAEFRLPAGVNCNVVELKDGAGVRNGIINVAGTNTLYVTNTSFAVPSAAIYLNASSCIHSGTIEEMHLATVTASYPTDIITYGRGYGIYLHATNASTPQEISGVTVNQIWFYCFRIGIYLYNERKARTGENGAYIDDNIFTNVAGCACSWFVNLTRAVNTSKCSISYNYLDQTQFQTGGWFSREACTWGLLRISGTGNHFSNVQCWDFSYLHMGSGLNAFYLTPDSQYNYFQVNGCNQNWVTWSGSHNTVMITGPLWDSDTVDITIDHVVQYHPH